MWKQCSEGLSTNTCSQGNSNVYNWQEALQLPVNINNAEGFAGHNDWRLPNIKELQSLAAYNATAPAINITIFPYKVNDSINPHWSNSPAVVSPVRADNRSWSLSRDGLTLSLLRNSSNRVRLVRDIP
jgi:hypothetical protein